jgi:hypothetical protein
MVERDEEWKKGKKTIKRGIREGRRQGVFSLHSKIMGSLKKR